MHWVNKKIHKSKVSQYLCFHIQLTTIMKQCINLCCFDIHLVFFWSKVYCFSFFLFKLSLKPIFACVRYQYGSKQKYPAKNHITRLIPLDHLTSRRCGIALTSKIIQYVCNSSDIQPLFISHSTF